MPHIFDMDGTMVDNMMVHHRAWQRTLAENGLDLTLDEVKASIHGINQEILERLFGDKYTPEQREQISDKKERIYRDTFRPDLRLLDGLPVYLEYLKADAQQMVIATAAPRINVDFVLDELDLRDYFTGVLQAEDVSEGKPHPEIYLKAAALTGSDPADCIVYEDSPTGALAASRAGSKIIVLTTTHTRKEFEGIDGIDKFISDFTELNYR